MDEATALSDVIHGIVDGDAIAKRRHPWANEPEPEFMLTVSNGTTDTKACSHDRAALLDLLSQLEALNYRFVRLERIGTHVPRAA